MAAYVLFDNLEVTDPVALERYKDAVGDVVARFGGRYLVLGGPCERIEGDFCPTFPVMLEFPDSERARQWYQSADYRELKALRHSASRSTGVIIDGLPSAR